jgi:hypothetical protein
MMIYVVRSEILISYRQGVGADRKNPSTTHVTRSRLAGCSADMAVLESWIPADSLREPTGIALSEQKSRRK